MEIPGVPVVPKGHRWVAIFLLISTECISSAKQTPRLEIFSFLEEYEADRRQV